MKVTLTDFTNHEFAYLADMISEKITDMGYNIEGFSFTLSVEFEESDDES